jgi:hypothetical protein
MKTVYRLGENMGTKIEEALIKLGIGEQNISKILEYVPQIITEYEHNYSVGDLKNMFETLLYIYMAQNIRDEGMWINESNLNRDFIEKLENFRLINRTRGPGGKITSIKTTDAGEKLSKTIMERKINQNALREMIESTPNMIWKIIQDRQILPISYPNKSYVQESDEFPQDLQDFLLSLPNHNEKCYNLCKAFCIKAVDEGWACIAHYYVSTSGGGGEEREEYYVLSPEVMDAIANIIPQRVPKELEHRLNEIKDKFCALNFLFHYSPDSYNGLGRYSQVEENILTYLKELTNSIETSKDLFTSGFTSEMPFMISDVDAYESKILKFEKELNKQLTDLLSETCTQTSEKKAIPQQKTQEQTQKLENLSKTKSEVKSEASILVGFECGTGKRIEIPLGHLFICGLTQESGKTTTLEALITRSGYPAIVFVTKPGEECFKDGKSLKPYFREDVEWKELEALFESLFEEKMKDIRVKLIELCELCKDENKLRNIKDKIDQALEDEKRKDRDKLILLQAYFKEVFKQLDEIEYTDVLELQNGINVMDLKEINNQLQGYIINSVLHEILNKRERTIVVIPEAWKFIPQSTNTPCKHPIEQLTRQGAVKNNYVWFDSQDIANVDKKILKNVSIWILGKQTENNEVKHTIKQIPLSKNKQPTEDIIQTLEVGEFFVCQGKSVAKTYVMPKWMNEEEAQRIAKKKAPF